MRKLLIVIAAIGLVLIFSHQVQAKIGVGVGVGKIQVDENLKPGIIYQLPAFTVLNTGDETSEYEVSIEYHEQQPELRPQQNWFLFSPQSFSLEPGGVQQVEMKLNLPLRMEPGKYFAYLEAHPMKKAEQGQSRVGIASAVKLNFTVAPANFLQGLYYKGVSFWNVYAPWPQRVVAVVAIILTTLLFKRFFKLEVNLKKSGKNKSGATDE